VTSRFSMERIKSTTAYPIAADAKAGKRRPRAAPARKRPRPPHMAHGLLTPSCIGGACSRVPRGPRGRKSTRQLAKPTAGRQPMAAGTITRRHGGFQAAQGA
jgi:hypothetical protein